jgi:uncharacterized protein (DUF58 family)
VRIWTTFPFGLTCKSIRIIQPDAIVILPAVHALHPDAFKRVLDHATTGSGTRPLPGASVEYYGVREYVPGDSPRRIAWRASARTGAIVVRQDSAPAPARVWIILRRSSSFDADAIESAVSLAASLVASSVQQGFAVGLVTDDGALTHPPRTGRLHIRRLMRDLAVWNPATSSPASLLPESAIRSGACVVVHIGAMEHAHTPPHAVHFTGADLPRLRISEGAPREAVPA